MSEPKACRYGLPSVVPPAPEPQGDEPCLRFPRSREESGRFKGYDHLLSKDERR